MKEVRIAELKSHLSEFLRAVQGGERVSVLDRNTPIAQLVPIPKRRGLQIRKPPPGTSPIGRIPLPKALSLKTDVVEVLLEERQPQR